MTLSNVLAWSGSQLHHHTFFSARAVCQVPLLYFLHLLNVCSVQEFLLSPFAVGFPCVTAASAPRAAALTSRPWALGLIFTSWLPVTPWLCRQHLGLCAQVKLFLPQPVLCALIGSVILITWSP